MYYHILRVRAIPTLESTDSMINRQRRHSRHHVGLAQACPNNTMTSWWCHYDIKQIPRYSSYSLVLQ